MRKILHNKHGQGALLLVTVLCGVGFILLTSSLDVFVRDYNYKAKDFNQVLLDEVTSSSFAVMESALERRLWEPPPDGSCMKSESFDVSGELPEGMSWKVTALYNPATKNFELTAQGTHRNLTSQFKKKIKIMDASDYLLLSTNPDKNIRLDRRYNKNSPSSLIARDRRIYTRGALVMRGVLDRSAQYPYQSYNTWEGTPAEFPAEWGTIIQGDRMQFGKGIYYEPVIVHTPTTVRSDNLVTLLSPYSGAWGSPNYPTYGSGGAGSAVFTSNYNLANSLRTQVSSNSSGPNTKASLRPYVYPVALFGGAPPLEAWNSVDNGAYFNDLDRYSIFYYGYAGANGYGVRFNATCMSRTTELNTRYCSNSEHFPKGFDQWRKDAGLEGYLFTADTTEVPSPTLSWDNLESLEEDAKQCGAVIDTAINAYTDCPIWDANFLTSYAATGSTSACQRTSTIDLDGLAIANFNAGAINNPANADRLLRRVIYVKGPSEIKQSDERGLMLTRLPDNTARKKASFWIVSEDMITLRGFQKDKTSPLNVNPAKLREVVFNDDVSGSPSASLKTPLNITLLSSEQTHLISEFYKEMTPSHLQTTWPASGGRIRPINHIMTDASRQEEDGFKYGFRSYKVNNVTVITNSNRSIAEPFFLRGLWGGPDSSAEQFPSNQCMISMAGMSLSPAPGYGYYATAQVPSYNSAANSPIPPLSSRFYNGKTRFPLRYVPEVFYVQQNAMNNGIDQSEVSLTGISIATDFSASTPSGKRNLQTALYNPVQLRPRIDNLFSLEHKHFAWDMGQYYKAKPAQTPCSLENMELIAPHNPAKPYDVSAASPSVNTGQHVYTQISPDDSYRNIGAIVGVDQLVIETKAGN